MITLVQQNITLVIRGVHSVLQFGFVLFGLDFSVFDFEEV